MSSRTKVAVAVLLWLAGLGLMASVDIRLFTASALLVCAGMFYASALDDR